MATDTVPGCSNEHLGTAWNVHGQAERGRGGFQRPAATGQAGVGHEVAVHVEGLFALSQLNAPRGAVRQDFDALAEFRTTIERVKSESKRTVHPIFGSLTHEEWDSFNLRHAEMHMSFVKLQEG